MSQIGARDAPRIVAFTSVSNLHVSVRERAGIRTLERVKKGLLSATRRSSSLV